MIFQKGKDYYLWQTPYNAPKYKERYAGLAVLLLFLFIGANLALAKPRILSNPKVEQFLSKVNEKKLLVENGFNHKKDYKGEPIGGSGNTASTNTLNAFKPSIKVNDLGIVISSISIQVVMRPGESKKVMTIASTGAKSVSMKGYPTSYGQGISWWPSAANFNKGAVDLSIKVAPEVPEGTYEGKAIIISHPSEKTKQIAEVSVIVDRNAPISNVSRASDLQSALQAGVTSPGSATTTNNYYSSTTNNGSSGTGGGAGGGSSTLPPSSSPPPPPPPPSGGGTGGGLPPLPLPTIPPVLPPLPVPTLPPLPIP